MAKRLTTAEKIRRYMEAHPNAKPKQIAQDLNVKVTYVHVLRSADKKARADGKPIRRIKGTYVKRITLNPTQVAVAKKLGLSAEQYIKEAKVPAQDHLVDTSPMLITMEEPKADPVNHPSHYKVGGIETIDFIEAKGLNYNLGNVVKYITRADHKGNRKQDLEKAMWYLNREIGAQ
jgi:hypothetical protein